MDIAVGDASLQKSQEEAYSRTCDYLQEIHTQVCSMNNNIHIDREKVADAMVFVFSLVGQLGCLNCPPTTKTC